jgi:hypothetical protein
MGNSRELIVQVSSTLGVLQSDVDGRWQRERREDNLVPVAELVGHRLKIDQIEVGIVVDQRVLRRASGALSVL